MPYVYYDMPSIQYSCFTWITGKLGESGPNLDLCGVNFDLSYPYLTS